MKPWIIKRLKGRILNLVALSYGIKRYWFEIPYIFDFLFKKRIVKEIRKEYYR